MTTNTSAVMSVLDSYLQSDIDALPYADDHAWTPDTQARVGRLIDEEMKAAEAATTPTMAAVTQQLEDAENANARAEEKFAARHPLAHAALEEAATKLGTRKKTGGGGGGGGMDGDDDNNMEVMRQRCEVKHDADWFKSQGANFAVPESSLPWLLCRPRSSQGTPGDAEAAPGV